MQTIENLHKEILAEYSPGLSVTVRFEDATFYSLYGYNSTNCKLVAEYIGKFNEIKSEKTLDWIHFVKVKKKFKIFTEFFFRRQIFANSNLGKKTLGKPFQWYFNT